MDLTAAALCPTPVGPPRGAPGPRSCGEGVCWYLSFPEWVPLFSSRDPNPISKNKTKQSPLLAVKPRSLLRPSSEAMLMRWRFVDISREPAVWWQEGDRNRGKSRRHLQGWLRGEGTRSRRTSEAVASVSAVGTEILPTLSHGWGRGSRGTSQPRRAAAPAGTCRPRSLGQMSASHVPCRMAPSRTPRGLHGRTRRAPGPLRATRKDVLAMF